MPWLPLVGSTMMLSLSISPSRSACSIMFSAVRVLMEPPTFSASTFTSISALPGSGMRFSRTMGVLPTASSIVL